MDQHLKWHQHICGVNNNMRETIFKFKRLKRLLDINTLKNICHVIVVNVLNYGLFT